MTIFTGADARKIEQQAVNLVRGQLIAGFADTAFAGDFAAYGGVKVITEELLTLPAAKDVLAKPVIFITIDNRKSKDIRLPVSGVTKTCRQHSITVTAEIVTSDRCYKAEPLVRDAIAGIIDKYKRALREAGFHEAKTSTDPRHVLDQTKVNPIAIMGDLFTLKGN